MRSDYEQLEIKGRLKAGVAFYQVFQRYCTGVTSSVALSESIHMSKKLDAKRARQFARTRRKVRLARRLLAKDPVYGRSIPVPGTYQRNILRLRQSLPPLPLRRVLVTTERTFGYWPWQYRRLRFVLRLVQYWARLLWNHLKERKG